MTTTFRGGTNVAMKLPKAQFDRTVEFYRDVLGLTVTEETGAETLAAVDRSVAVDFGPMTLWLDRVDNYAQAGLWLELFTDDVDGATEYLAGRGIEPQDELERLPGGLAAHWITNPAGIPHIVRTPD